MHYEEPPRERRRPWFENIETWQEKSKLSYYSLFKQ